MFVVGLFVHFCAHVAYPLGMKYFSTLTISKIFLLLLVVNRKVQLSARAGKLHGPKKEVLKHLMQCSAWKTEGVHHLEKVLGNFDGRVVGKSACEVACKVAGWAGLGLVLGKGGLGGRGWKRCWEILMGGGGWENCLRGCMRGCWVGRARIGAWKLPWVEAWKTCSGCSYQELLGHSSYFHTREHHHVEANVVSMGQLTKSPVNTKVEF